MENADPKSKKVSAHLEFRLQVVAILATFCESKLQLWYDFVHCLLFRDF